MREKNVAVNKGLVQEKGEITGKSRSRREKWGEMRKTIQKLFWKGTCTTESGKEEIKRGKRDGVKVKQGDEIKREREMRDSNNSTWN